PARQPQTPESRAGSDNGGAGERSLSLGEVALQRSFAAFSREQIPLWVPHRSKVCLSPAMNRLSHHCSFAMAPDRFTLVDQPTIMLRNVSHPSAKTRITCGTTKRMKSQMSQKCQTRAASKPPNSAASQWS